MVGKESSSEEKKRMSVSNRLNVEFEVIAGHTNGNAHGHL